MVKFNSDLEIRIARRYDMDALVIFVWKRLPRTNQLAYLTANGEQKIIGAMDPMEPALELPMVDQDSILRKLRDNIDELLMDKDRLIAEERLRSMSTANDHLIKDAARERKLVNWFMKHVESH